MENKNLYGKPVADSIYQSIGDLKHARLMVIADSEEKFKCSPSEIYVNGKSKAIKNLNGISHLCNVEGIVNNDSVKMIIDKYSNYDGVMIQLPVDGLDIDTLSEHIPSNKDVDGFNPTNLGRLLRGDESGLLPCTPLAVTKVLEYYNIELKGKIVAVVGRSNLVGKPLAVMLINRGATVISCNSNSNLSEVLPLADIIISAIGKPKYIKKELIKENSVLIDVGINRDENGKLCGDFDYYDVYNKCKMITPVPGGIGPVTIACLVNNLHKTKTK